MIFASSLIMIIIIFYFECCLWMISHFTKLCIVWRIIRRNQSHNIKCVSYWNERIFGSDMNKIKILLENAIIFCLWYIVHTVLQWTVQKCTGFKSVPSNININSDRHWLIILRTVDVGSFLKVGVLKFFHSRGREGGGWEWVDSFNNY